MSAFCGMVRWNGQVAEEDFSDAVDTLRTVPGDREGRLVREHVGLYQQTLWISPESTRERLPRHAPEMRLSIAADVWLHYRDDLVARLGLSGRPAATWTDSDLVLLAYRKWGTACARYLEGDFAFAIWDHARRRLYCARDVMGLRPLYFHAAGTFVAFGSDLESLLAVRGVSREMNPAYLARYLMDTPLPACDTAFTAVSRVQPGHWLTATEHGVQTEAYWRPEDAGTLRLKRDEEYAACLHDLLARAVEERCRTPFKVGGTLSGGLDSTTLAALAVPVLARSGRSYEAVTSIFSPDYDGEHEDERAFVACLQRDVPNIAVSYHHLERPFCLDRDPISWLRFIRVNRVNDVYLYQVLLRRLVERGCRVGLTGTGGDYLISRNTLLPLNDLLHAGRIPSLMRALRDGARFRGISTAALLRPVLAYEFDKARATLAGRFRGRRDARDDTPAHSFAHPDWLKQLPLDALLDEKRRIREKRRYGTLHERIVEALFYAQPYPFPDEFPLSGRLPLQEGYPLLDRRVVECCMALPTEQFVAQGMSRSLLRRAAEGILPDEIRLRPGKGQVFPNYADYLGRMVPDLHDRITRLPSSAACWACIDRAKLTAALERIRVEGRVTRAPAHRNCLNAAGLALYIAARENA